MRWPHEFLFSMNLATVVVWASEERLPSVLLNVLGNAVERYLIPVLRKLSFTGNSRPAGYLFYFAMCLLLGLSIFLVLRLLAYLSVLRSPVLVLVGALNVASFPISYLYLHSLWGISATQTLWLSVEMVIFAVLAVVYRYQEQRIPPVPGILLLATHFGVWAWVSGGFLFPILGFLSSLTWGLYMRLSPTVCPQPEVATQ